MASGDVSGSFRDTSGFIFTRDGVIYRQVNQVYRGHYDLLMTSGLYAELTNAGLLVPHEEGDVSLGKSAEAYKVLRPEPVKFTSYPYEWCFSQLKDAALTTLEIQKRALKSGMTLKDASAYNIQFVKGKPVLIDTLSFEKYVEGKPWVAYRQFCQHFLAPLALMSYKDVRLNQLFRVYIDGVPLDMASSLLPMRSRLNLPVLLNIHMHAASQKRYADKPVSKGTLGKRMSRTSFLGLVDSLESCIRGLVWRPRGTEWAEYYQDDSYTPEALEHKKRIVGDFLDKAKPNAVWDLGGNIGVFSRLASGRGIDTVSFDIDPACVEINYRTVKDKGETNILPLLLDLTNPSPGIGWENEERTSLLERGGAKMVMALALVHHLAISNNVPLGRIAGFLRRMCRWLIIEFVPKSDPKVQKLLATRKDIFPDYTREAFEREFGKQFRIQSVVDIMDSPRTVYLMVAEA